MRRPLLFFLAILAIARPSLGDEPVSYSRVIAPFIDDQCIACHDDGFETSDLAMHTVDALKKGGRRGPAIVPGNGKESLIIQFLTGEKQPQMPPKTQIPLDLIDQVKRWIDEGAMIDDAPAVVTRRETARMQAAEEAATFASDAPPPVTSLSYSPDGKTLAVASYKEVILVDPSTGETIRRLAGPPDQVASVAFAPDGKSLAAASGIPGKIGEVRVWEPDTWNELATLRGHDDTVLSVAWRPNSDELATCSLDKLIMIWNVKSRSVVRTIKSHADIVTSLAYSPDGKRLASGSADKTAKIFDADTGLQTAGLTTHNDAVLAVAFSPDGRFLVTASADRGMSLWKLDNLNNPIRGFGHTGPVYALAWRPDSTSVWAGSGGRPSMLSYKTENGDRAVRIDESTVSPDWTYAVAVSPDNATVAAGGWDGTITVWNLEDGAVLRKLVPGRE
jgi:WD40 repeat protein